MINYIADILKTSYPTYAIYSETVEQTFIRPCFFVKKINGSGKRVMGNKFELKNIYSIEFFPIKTDNTEKEQCLEVEDTLYEVLDTVNNVHTANMDAVINTDVLVFTFDLDYTVKLEEEEVEDMEIISIKY